MHELTDTSLQSEPQTISEEELHQQTSQYIKESHHLVFQKLPSLLNQIIELELWNKRDRVYASFGEYALEHSSDGLSVINNNMLGLLRLAMDINGEHAKEWGDVLAVVDGTVRTYAKENKIAIKDLSRNLHEPDPDTEAAIPAVDNAITYLPSRSKSQDAQLMKLKMQDEEIYKNVVTGKMKLKEAFPPKPKKQLIPIEAAKTKFMNLSDEDRKAFLEWIEEQARNL